MRSIRELKNIKGKTALVRADFNVPISAGKIQDDFRIKAAMPTLKFLLAKGVKVIAMSHHSSATQSMKPVQKYLDKKFSKGKIILLENLRQNKGEEKNDQNFAKKLAKLGDFYVNEAFPVCHRVHASIVSVPKYLPSYAGFQLEKEVKNLSVAFKKPKHPFLFILGGAKFSTKMPLIKKYLKLADKIFIGGALMNDFIKAEGYEVGKSLVDSENYGIEKIMKNKKLIIPGNVVVKNAKKMFMQKKVRDILKSDAIVDVGKKSIQILAPIIKKSKLILWNGPIGKYEAGGAKGTKEVLKLVAKSRAESIIGGGDTVTLVSELKMEKKFSFVSTGGGATLDFLANGTLPGIKALG
jgi:3-phosphoglycerate kinase